MCVLNSVVAEGAVLFDPLAYLGYEVAQRMESPNQWIVSVEAEQGNVVDSTANTAVHERKVGNRN